MIVVNITMSFADAIQQEAIKWLKTEYMPLLNVCPVVATSDFYTVEAQQGADDCFALQIRFENEEDFDFYQQRYQQDFESALYAKFKNQFGMFKTKLTTI